MKGGYQIIDLKGFTASQGKFGQDCYNYLVQATTGSGDKVYLIQNLDFGSDENIKSFWAVGGFDNGYIKLTGVTASGEAIQIQGSNGDVFVETKSLLMNLLPSPPENDGIYHLVLTRSSGDMTYEWLILS